MNSAMERIPSSQVAGSAGVERVRTRCHGSGVEVERTGSLLLCGTRVMLGMAAPPDIAGGSQRRAGAWLSGTGEIRTR
ncbi:hypothetical protein CLV40_108226 [Actinokineospora auranticolor]|uniref:Uncharacterized protein n=1 Tax=Actinokineospora auranticolor TaxID=155976 RepID=A0A2S6GPW0_9PSEU|nr:hypothetical protein CLV40_108226 [Actinokineospora auranticolor]